MVSISQNIAYDMYIMCITLKLVALLLKHQNRQRYGIMYSMKIIPTINVNKTIQILLVFIFMANAACAFYGPLLAIYITNQVVNATLITVGIGVAFYSITKALFQVPLARFLDLRVGEKDDFLVIFMGILLAIVYSFSYLFIHQPWQLYSLQVVAGIADACLMAAYFAFFSHHIDRKSQAFEWSLYSGGVTLSIAGGGLVGALVAQLYGFSAVFILAGTLNIIALFFILFLYPHIKVIPK